MPLLANPTTIAQLQDAFISAIEGVSPRTTRQQGSVWKYFARDHAPTMGTRWFRFEWDHAEGTGEEFMWRGGASQPMICTIVVDYGGLPSQERDLLVNDDFHQLWDVLDALRNTTDGLRRVQGNTWGIEAGNEDQASYALVYSVRYLQARFTG